MSGFTVRLFDSTGNTELRTTVTNTSGIYTFPDVSAGIYFVRWFRENCSGDEVPEEVQVTVNAGETKTQDIDVSVLC
jgi:hypothetical protein